MKTVRIVLGLCYVMIALSLVALVAATWGRHHDEMWAQMGGARRNVDILQSAIILYAIGIAYGLVRRREWGRVFAISLAAIVFFYSVGIQLVGPLLFPEFRVTLAWDGVLIGTLAIACIVGLTRARCATNSGGFQFRSNDRFRPIAAH